MNDELDFEQLKISAFYKLNKINEHGDVTPKRNFSKNQDTKLINKPLVEINKSENGNNLTSICNSGLSIRHVLKELEMQRQEDVKNVIEARITKLKEFSRKQTSSQRQQWLKQQQAFIEDMQQKESFIFQTLSKFDKNNLKEQTKLALHYQDLAERRRLHEEELKARERQRQIISANISGIKKHQQEFFFIYQQLVHIIQTCDNTDKLKNLLGDDFKLFKTLPETLDEVIIKCKNGKVTEADVKQAFELVAQLNTLKIKVEKAVEEISAREVQTNLQEPSTLQSISVPSKPENPIPHKGQDVVDKSAKLPNFVESDITQYVSLTNLKEYIELMDFLEKHTTSFKDLENDNSQKSFKFECKKAVNTPVNSLSGVNSEHVLDKYNRLHQLLSGKSVLVGGKQINASRHSQGVAFCMDLLAKKFVLQGDLMVSSNPESAFCYASVIISLWNDFPVFGKLVLAYFYKLCPYLVPFYLPRQVGESDEEFYTKQGYQYSEGQIEKQDKFLKRMTGIIRLYSAILIIKPKRGQANTPHNLQHGWRLLSSVLKLEPRVDITATVLHTFLETVGFEMEAKYGRLFIKLIKFIMQKFLPSCREKCSGGAVTRLELLLNKYVKNKVFEQPSGYLAYSSW